MNKRTLVLIAVLVVLALYWIGSGRSSLSETRATAPAIATAGTWQPLLEFSGNGIKHSESFRPQAREVRISWDSKAQHAGLSIFQIYVQRSSDDGLVQVAANTTAEGEDSTIVRIPTGEYYLKVNSTTRWSVKAEEKR